MVTIVNYHMGKIIIGMCCVNMSDGFGVYLRMLRKEKDITLRQLGKHSKVSHGYLSQVERGERGTPSPDILERLAGPLGISYEKIMREAGYLKTEEENKNDIREKLIFAVSDDPSMIEFLNEIINREELKLLLKQVTHLTPESIKKIIKVIKAIEDND